MAETISIGAAAARVVASIGVVFDRIMDSADEYAEALVKFTEPEPPVATTPSDPYVVGVRVYDSSHPLRVGTIIQTVERDRVAPIRVQFDRESHKSRWYNICDLVVLES